MTWIKICGITNLEDGLTAVDAGADALGFVFHEKSPRCVDPETVRKIVRDLPQTIEKVGVFVNQTAESICAIADEAGLTAVQLHGDNMDPDVADSIVEHHSHLKVVIGLSMNQAKPEDYAMKWHPSVVHAFLVDAANSSSSNSSIFNSSSYGGTGKTFDWQINQPSVEAIATLGRVVVAGGLTSRNVPQAIRVLRPWGVDVSSGVEAQPGKKDPQKVRAFIDAVRHAGKN
jgi:phosphoribosylanthranilate isomerase